MKYKWQKTYSILFFIVIISILFSQIMVPGMQLSSVSEKYLWRKDLIDIYRRFEYSMGDKVFPTAVFGKDEWLFFTADLSLRNYQKTAPLNVSNIKKLLRVFEEINEKVESYGGTFLVVVAPDKSTIYPQFMPDEIPVIGEVSSLDRLIERVDTTSNIKLLDLRPTLMHASEYAEVYYKSDTHWNCIGAFYAYQEIFYEVQSMYPELKLYGLDDFDFTYSNQLLDISTLIGVDLKERSMILKPKFDTNISNENLPDLMMIHDSFYLACLNKFMEPSFGEIFSVQYKDLEMEDILQKIEEQKPKIVIVEFVERFMEFFFRHLSE